MKKGQGKEEKIALNTDWNAFKSHLSGLNLYGTYEMVTQNWLRTYAGKKVFSRSQQMPSNRSNNRNYSI